MGKNQRFVALLGDGREHFRDTELDAVMPTEPVVIDAYGFSDAYRYDGYVFLNADWFKKYSKTWQNDTSEIDALLVKLVRYASPGSKSENLVRIQAYLAEPPETIAEAIEVWRSFYNPVFAEI
ncbi:MAG TPA: hypothetical protein VGN64_19950 [Dyadobacter sp.]|nr:hypothetical protein [Dyadobacter sp.]